MASKASARDPSTLSNYDEFRTDHVTADLDIDFAKKRLVGTVVLRLRALKNGVSKVVLDTSYLDVRQVNVRSYPVAEWSLDARTEPYGSALNIQLNKNILGDSTLRIEVCVASRMSHRV